MDLPSTVGIYTLQHISFLHQTRMYEKSPFLHLQPPSRYRSIQQSKKEANTGITPNEQHQHREYHLIFEERVYWKIKCVISFHLAKIILVTCLFFIGIVFFNLRLEYAYVFHKSSLKICLKYAYFKTFKRANFMV